MPAKAQKDHFASRSHESLPLYGTRGGLAAARARLPTAMRSFHRGGPSSSLGAQFVQDLKDACCVPRIAPSQTQPVGSENKLSKNNSGSLACSALMQVSRADGPECARMCVHTDQVLASDRTVLCVLPPVPWSVHRWLRAPIVNDERGITGKAQCSQEWFPRLSASPFLCPLRNRISGAPGQLSWLSVCLRLRP